MQHSSCDGHGMDTCTRADGRAGSSGAWTSCERSLGRPLVQGHPWPTHAHVQGSKAAAVLGRAG
eukprot:scaffold51213_cov55-Phaeocystis_antarctica.AAC.4